MNVNKIIALVKAAFDEWVDDKASRLAAALAYYTIFSLAPLLVIAIAIAGRLFGQDAAEHRIVTEIGGLVGRAGAEAIQSLIENARHPTDSIVATIVSVLTLLLGASVVFGELQDALNTLWGVSPKPGRGIWGTVKDRIFSFALVISLGFLLIVSLVVSALIAAAMGYLRGFQPNFLVVIQALNEVFSLGILTVLFGLIFKVVPDVKIAWRDVWIGAIVTALLFTLGKLAIGFYIGNSAVTSTYGAAGSLVVVIVWVYYSTQIVFLGTEFTKVYAITYGSRVDVADNAVPVAVLRARRKFDLKQKVHAIRDKVEENVEEAERKEERKKVEEHTKDKSRKGET